MRKQPDLDEDLVDWLRRRRSFLAAGAAASVAFAGYGMFCPLRLLSQVARLRLAMVGIYSRFIKVNGFRIRYFEGGPAATADKPPVLLLHGLGSRAEDLTELMVRLGADRRVYAMDLLGYGKSDKPPDASYSIAQEAGIVEEFLRAKGIGDYDLGGWSMGGWVALRVALDQQGRGGNDGSRSRVRRLVLLSSAGLKYQAEFDPGLFVPDSPEKVRGLNELLFPDPVSLPWFVTRALVRRARREGWVIERSMKSMLAGRELLDGELRRLKMPVLIVWGSEDGVVPLEVGKRMHLEIPQSELEVYDGCGHLGPVECAGRIGPRMIEFLSAEGREQAEVRGG